MKTPADETGSVALPSSVTSDMLALTKPGLTGLSVATAVGAAALASGDAADMRVLTTLFGTWLIGSGAASLNQALEREFDARMRRTAARPVASGRLSRGTASSIGGVLAAAGIGLLWVTTTPLAASFGAVTLVTYLMLYTPLKRLTPFAFVVGGIPGALPPVLGWAAVRGEAGLEAWTLFAILFCWQIPHFLSLGWIYRNDYSRAGYPILPVVDASGRSTARQMVVYAALLVPAVMLASLTTMAGPIFGIGGPCVAIAYFVVVLRFALRRDGARARAVFLVSITALPLLFGLMLLDRLI